MNAYASGRIRALLEGFSSYKAIDNIQNDLNRTKGKENEKTKIKNNHYLQALRDGGIWLS